MVDALRKQGISSPIDLALIGEADELPEATVEMVRDGIDVKGFGEALTSMFKAARAGLDVSMSLLAHRISSSPQPLPWPTLCPLSPPPGLAH